MKKLFVSVLAIASLVACNNEQTLVQKGPAPMEFGGAFVENALTTRAAEDPSYKTATLEAFDVWAWMDDENGMVLTDENVELVGGKWGYASTQYWSPNHTYFFDAVAPMDSANWTYDLAAEKNTIAFKNVDGTEDLLYATAKVETFGMELNSDYDAVKLSFKHLLSKTKFTFKNGFPVENVSIVVKNVEMTSYKEATYNTVDKTWGDVSGDIVLAYGDVEETFSGEKTEATYERLTIPADASKVYNVSYDVYVYQGSNLAYSVEGKTAQVTDVEFQQGKAYNFVATITPENIIEGGLKPIEFEVEVIDWVYVTQDEGQIAEAELRAAVQLGGNVELTNDVVLTAPLQVTKDLVLNLGGYTLKNAVENAATDVIVVAEGATLTVEGDGVIEAVSGNDGYTIIADGTVVINGGEFKSGKDANGAANAVVYARGNGQVYVNGGYFPNENASNYVLNKKDADKATTVIEVRGGKFVGFNPAQSPSEYPVENFVAEGYYSTEVEAGVFVVADAYTVANVAGLQAALDAKIENIRFAANIEGDVVVSQTEGVNYTIDGAGYKFDGTLGICGNARSMGTETLTIKNVAFETAATSLDFISSTKAYVAAGQNYNYAHNVTIDGCTFTAAEGSDVVGIRGWQDFNLVVKNCDMKGGHSLAQITASSDTVFENCTVEAGRGINFLTSCVGLVVANCDITATKADGYGIRCDAGATSCLNLSGSTINAYEPIVLRSAKASFVFNVETTTLNATGEYQVVVAGEKPVMNGAEAYTCNM